MRHTEVWRSFPAAKVALTILLLQLFAFPAALSAQTNAPMPQASDAKEARLSDPAAWSVDSRHTQILIADYSACADCGANIYRVCRHFMGDIDSNTDRGHVYLEVDGKQFMRRSPGGKNVPLTLQPNSCAYVSGNRIGLAYVPPQGQQKIYRTFGSYTPVVDPENAGPLPSFTWAMWGDPSDAESDRYATQLLSLREPAIVRFCTNLPANTSYETAARVRLVADGNKQYIQPFPPMSCMDLLSTQGDLLAHYVPSGKLGPAPNFNAFGSVMFASLSTALFEKLVGDKLAQ